MVQTHAAHVIISPLSTVVPSTALLICTGFKTVAGHTHMYCQHRDVSTGEGNLVVCTQRACRIDTCLSLRQLLFGIPHRPHLSAYKFTVDVMCVIADDDG